MYPFRVALSVHAKGVGNDRKPISGECIRDDEQTRVRQMIVEETYGKLDEIVSVFRHQAPLFPSG